MAEESDQALIECILSRGPDGKQAFQTLYDRYQRQVYSVCYRLVGDAHRAADATQESFLAILKGLETFNYKSSFRTWLFQVSKNAALQMMRRPSNRPLHSLHANDDAEGSDGARVEGRVEGRVEDGMSSTGREASQKVHDDPTQLELVIESEFEDDLQRALDRLNPQHAEILSLRYFSNCSYEELAVVLDCSIGTVKSRLSRAHRALRPLLVDVLKRHDRIGRAGAEPQPDPDADPGC
jgi:RNA polymerase sigma-70 factor (ECF subfamily)